MPRSVGSTISCIVRAVICGRHDRRRRIGAHAAGIGAGVAVADALVVLRRAAASAVLPSHSAKKLASSPSRNSSMTTSRAGLAEGAAEAWRRPRPRASSSVMATITPLPAARPSALTTIGAPCART